MQIPGYTGLDRIARGGFATVYRGVEMSSGRTVAIKVLDRIGPKEERRFTREFQTLGQLADHPNVVQVLDHVWNDEGVPCLILEYMGGGSLVDLMDLQPGGLDEGDAALIANEVLTALEAAHSAGVLHRDIKPSNVLLGSGSIKLADFGIAKFSDSTATTSSAISTTVLFAAPETIMDRTVTEQSDLYSLGATVYALLTGRPPHSSVAEALAGAAARSELDLALPGVTESFADWVRTLLSTEPSDRPESAAEARASLQAFLPTRPGPELARTMALGPIASRPAIDPPTTMRTTQLQPSVEAPATEQPDRRKFYVAVALTAVATFAVGYILFRPDGNEKDDVANPTVVPTTSAVTTAAVTTEPPTISTTTPAPGTSTVATGSIERIDIGGSEANPVWSPSGDRIAFQTDDDATSELYVLGVSGVGLLRLTDNDEFDGQPSWSPDGSLIAYQCTVDTIAGICLIRPDGSDLLQLTNTPAAERRPAWSPDGSLIAYQSDEGGDYEVWVMKVDGSDPRQLTDAPGFDGQPSWSPDGSMIAFRCTGTVDSEICTMSADGSNLQQLTDSVGLDRQPVWSPDGQRLLFVSDRTGDHEVYVMNVDGSGVTNLTNHLAIDGDPTWHPDGNKIAFQSTRDSTTGEYDIYILELMFS